MPYHIPIPMNKDRYDTLADDFQTNILGYDYFSKTTWCLAKATVVLCLAHAIIASRQYRIFNGDRQTCLRFPSLKENGTATARDTLRSSLDLRLRKHETEDKLGEEPFTDTVRQIWHSLGAVWVIVLSFNDCPGNYYTPPFKYVLIYTMVQDL